MFTDRAHAGRALAGLLKPFRSLAPVVVALPRGGVVVGYEVAASLHAPLEVLVVRKLGAPDQPELAIGAVVEIEESTPHVFLRDPAHRAGATPEYLASETTRQIDELRRRQSAYRSGLPPVPLRSRTVILVDDGIATGSTVRAALEALRRSAPARLILAVPVSPPRTLERLRSEADEVFCAEAPEQFEAVGQFYGHFPQTEDAEVMDLLSRARSIPVPPAAAPDTAPDGTLPKGTQ